jgi:hypothetical protein
MSKVLRSALLLPFLVAPAGTSCDDSREVAPLKDGTAECDELGELCHDAGDALGGEYEGCHEIGHERVGDVCLANFTRCKELCEGAPLGEGGAGGEGGGGHAEAGAHSEGGTSAH